MSKNSALVAIASRDPSRSQDIASRYSIPRAYGTYDSVLQDADVEAVYVPLPNHLHVPWAIRCLEAGKHVLCEKPIALNAVECEELLAAQIKSGATVSEFFAIRSHPQWQRALDIIRSGRIGRIRTAIVGFSFFTKDPSDIRNILAFGGGAVMDLGCYAVNLARLLFGEEPQRVLAMLDRDPQFQIDRLSSVILEFASGHCIFNCGLQSVFYQNLQVLGETGRIEITYPFVPHPYRRSRLLVDPGYDVWGSKTEIEEFEPIDHYKLHIERLSLSIRGLAEPPTTLADSLRNTIVIDAIFRSAQTGREVAI
jgi:predicted dehydrogenase